MSAKPVMPEVRILEDAAAARRSAAEEFAGMAARSIRRRGRFDVALAGGSTPRGMYGLLADRSGPYRSRIPWDRIRFYWGDERHVPPDHLDSNFRMAWEAMLSKVPVPTVHIHRVPAELADADRSASLYERVLRDQLKARSGAGSSFDLVLLGLGPEGHTASLFPGSPALLERRRWVRANWIAKLKSRRITLTLPAINAADNVVFLVVGKDKAGAVRRALEKGDVPAGRVQPRKGRILWILDRDAASLL